MEVNLSSLYVLVTVRQLGLGLYLTKRWARDTNVDYRSTPRPIAYKLEGLTVISFGRRQRSLHWPKPTMLQQASCRPREIHEVGPVPRAANLGLMLV